MVGDPRIGFAGRAPNDFSYHVTRPLDQLAVHSISAALPLP
ncbi:MAG TPA: hypothetical protein VF293_06890 [Candidatus Limnocylindrales bacterium]